MREARLEGAWATPSSPGLRSLTAKLAERRWTFRNLLLTRQGVCPAASQAQEVAAEAYAAAHNSAFKAFPGVTVEEKRNMLQRSEDRRTTVYIARRRARLNRDRTGRNRRRTNVLEMGFDAAQVKQEPGPAPYGSPRCGASASPYPRCLASSSASAVLIPSPPATRRDASEGFSASPGPVGSWI